MNTSAAAESQYPHNWKPIPFGTYAGLPYCERCRTIDFSAEADADQYPFADVCERHPDFPRIIVPTSDIRPGDLIRIATGVTREIEDFVVHAVFPLEDGSLSLRARYASNPRGVDWSLHVPAVSSMLAVVSRGVARVEDTPRMLLNA